MADAIAGYGTQLLVEVSAVLTAIPQLKDFTLPTGETDQIDVTAQDSPNRTKEYIAGFIETGELDAEFFFDPNNEVHQELWALKESGTTVSWQVIAPDTEDTTFDFEAFVTALEVNFPVEDALTCSMTIKLSGAVTMTGYSS